MKYASDEIGEVKAVRGHRHDYLAMVLDYSRPGVLQVNMTSLSREWLKTFQPNLKGKVRFHGPEIFFG